MCHKIAPGVRAIHCAFIEGLVSVDSISDSDNLRFRWLFGVCERDSLTALSVLFDLSEVNKDWFPEVIWKLFVDFLDYDWVDKLRVI